LALENDPTQIGFMDVDWHKWHQYHGSTAVLPKFADVLDTRAPEGNAAVKQFRALLLAAAPHERSEITALALADLIGETMRMSPDKIDLQRPLTEMGVDSLMTLELELAVEARFGVGCSFLELQKGGGILDLAKGLVSRMGVAAEREQ
jgi:acyl carrier protein